MQWLHEQIRLIGYEPVPLERISSYRGLRNSSLRVSFSSYQSLAPTQLGSRRCWCTCKTTSGTAIYRSSGRRSGVCPRPHFYSPPLIRSSALLAVLELESALVVRTAAEESLQFRRHSIAVGAVVPPSGAPGYMA